MFSRVTPHNTRQIICAFYRCEMEYLRSSRGLSLPATHWNAAQLADAFHLARSTPKGLWMFGKMPRLNPLESRKQSLVSESELNCAKVVGDMAAPTVGVRSLVSRRAGGGPGGVPARKACAHRCETFLGTNRSQRHRTDFPPLAGVPCEKSRSRKRVVVTTPSQLFCPKRQTTKNKTTS